MDPGEDCDKTELNGQTCTGLGFVGGELTCRADCKISLCSCDWSGESFQVTAADKAVWESYSSGYEWGQDPVVVHYLTGPTMSEAFRGLYHQNPGLYPPIDTEPQIVPDPLPDIVGGVASGFDFKLADVAPNGGQQVLDNSTIKDSLADTPISGSDKVLMWKPTVAVFLYEWDIDKSMNLYWADLAIDGQKWGSDASQSPQFAEHTYLHGGDIWIKISFHKHVQLGTGVTDSDGDGFKEIFGKIDPDHFGTDVYDILDGDYSSLKYDVNGFRDVVACGSGAIMGKIYEAFPMVVSSEIGADYELSGQGTIEHPFIVMRGDAPRDHMHVVLLVEP
jgi:hypothetical protein